MNKEQLLRKLNGLPFKGSEVTRLANTGDFAGAAEYAAKSGIWGIWGYCREVAGLPFDDAAREQWLTEYKAVRAAKFPKAINNES